MSPLRGVVTLEVSTCAPRAGIARETSTTFEHRSGRSPKTRFTPPGAGDSPKRRVRFSHRCACRREVARENHVRLDLGQIERNISVDAFAGPQSTRPRFEATAKSGNGPNWTALKPFAPADRAAHHPSLGYGTGACTWDAGEH
jgi:hypothetical protein